MKRQNLTNHAFTRLYSSVGSLRERSLLKHIVAHFEKAKRTDDDEGLMLRFRVWGVFKLWILQWLRILDCIFSAYCAHRAILFKMAIFKAILLMISYEI
jgi:hypothetical protein